MREVYLGSSDERGSYNFPLPLVAGGRFDGDEPPLFDEDIRQAQSRFLVSDGVGSVDIDFPRGDGGLGPVVWRADPPGWMAGWAEWTERRWTGWAG